MVLIFWLSKLMNVSYIQSFFDVARTGVRLLASLIADISGCDSSFFEIDLICETIMG